MERQVLAEPSPRLTERSWARLGRRHAAGHRGSAGARSHRAVPRHRHGGMVEPAAVRPVRADDAQDRGALRRHPGRGSGSGAAAGRDPGRLRPPRRAAARGAFRWPARRSTRPRRRRATRRAGTARPTAAAARSRRTPRTAARSTSGGAVPPPRAAAPPPRRRRAARHRRRAGRARPRAVAAGGGAAAARRRPLDRARCCAGCCARPRRCWRWRCWRLAGAREGANAGRRCRAGARHPPRLHRHRRSGDRRHACAWASSDCRTTSTAAPRRRWPSRRAWCRGRTTSPSFRCSIGSWRRTRRRRMRAPWPR